MCNNSVIVVSSLLVILQLSRHAVMVQSYFVFTFATADDYNIS